MLIVDTFPYGHIRLQEEARVRDLTSRLSLAYGESCMEGVSYMWTFLVIVDVPPLSTR